ncbi:hypothetical protein JRG66_01790 [Salinimicrobium tongyeongense]|uniref:DUF1574 domain-containing protein n=1 Tax=Salinimicrobium tongyeongense TaxID=2809707 RepID=A0ABY6NRW1_9FLAO|nr:hypothetical protein [Salinimicrobium tongyeongense]UZH55650.1 hypothetical protein JRG66_01790 [Salinimicrobium tongyeongense]
MKGFILYILKILGVFVIGVVLLEQVYDHVFKKGIVRNKLQKVLSLEEGDHYEFVFLGSSRTENTIDCEIIEKITGKSCINLGVAGSSLKDSYVLLKLLLEKGIVVDHVFLQVDYSYNEKSADLTPAFKATLIPFRSHPAIREELEIEDDGSYILNFPFYAYLKYEKIVGFREIVNQTILNDSGKNYENGFYPLTGTGKQLYGSLPAKIANTNRVLSNMEKMVSGKRTKLHYFFAPYCQQVENRDYAMKLQDKLPEIYNYIDIFDRKENLFADCGHLNLSGAQEFTKILITDFLHREAMDENDRNGGNE